MLQVNFYEYIGRIFGIWVICVGQRLQITTISPLTAATSKNLLFYLYKTSFLVTLHMPEFFRCELNMRLKCCELLHIRHITGNDSTSYDLATQGHWQKM